ncbi:MAG TPA: lipopolysaccharide kinase InaA family protein [Sedimentisphaerales bacterium]|nr:lipopolysaccharide kinase InaA family protein [Sedimentisphaerales bacterium]HNU31470.1 lipopolysaccharide kinase InaA family protein [Sedimentisphaerales bacterium]
MRFAVSDTRWTVCAGLEDQGPAESFSSLDRVFELTGPLASKGAFCHVIRVRVGDRDYYVKRYCPQGKHVRKALGRDHAETECRNLAYFARLGIPVPKVVARGSQRTLGLLRRGALVTEGIPLSTDLQTLACTRPDLFHDRRWLSHILGLVADYVHRLHEDGFAHRDLKWRNILVTTGDPPRVFFLDCPSGRHTSGPSLRHSIIRDLAMLDKSARMVLSRTIRLRFFRRYLGRTRLSPEDRALMTRIMTFESRRRWLAVPQSLNL